MTNPPQAQRTLLTPELERMLEVWDSPVQSAPIEFSEIRRWAIAVYWPETPPRLFWDLEYARQTAWGGPIAPREFNPFTWPPQRPPDAPNRKPKPGVGERMMHAGNIERYGAVMRVGDVITARSALVKLEEKTGRMGLTLYRYHESRWMNQKGEFVKSKTLVSVQY